MTLLIKNGRLITDKDDFIADIFIEKEKISTIFEKINHDADSIIDAKGKLIIPGGIDVHTHLDMPLGNIKSADDFETGTIAAAFGGTTTLIDFPTQVRGQNIQRALSEWQKKADNKACIDYGFHMIISDTTHLLASDLEDLIDNGITSFKLFMAYPQSLMLNDGDIFKIMREAQQLGVLVCMHAENGLVIEYLINAALREGKTAPIYHALTRPASMEGEAVNRTIALSQLAGVPVYIVHVSTNEALRHISYARDHGLPVYAETCPQYLMLSLEDMINTDGFESAKYVFTPPLREPTNQKKIWQAIVDGYIQVIATDHCPFNLKGQKDLGRENFRKIPNGAPGIENRMQLIYEYGVIQNRIDLKQWVAICATNPAKIFGLYPRKGTIDVGSDADLVIWNPDRELTISADKHHMNVDYNLYEGIKISGSAETVISRGEIIIENNNYSGKTGRGQYLKRDLFSADLVF